MNGPDQPSREDLRAALRWTYSTRIRDNPEPPDQLQPAIAWLTGHTVRMDAFRKSCHPESARPGLLTRITQTKTGCKATASTATRKRMILHNAMEYACATGVLSENPLTHIRWTRQRTTNEVDPRVVINADPAHRFLTTVEADGERGRHLKALLRLHVIRRPPPRGSHRAAPLEHHSPHRVRTVEKDAAH
jgi:hypothetical protein